MKPLPSRPPPYQPLVLVLLLLLLLLVLLLLLLLVMIPANSSFGRQLLHERGTPGCFLTHYALSDILQKRLRRTLDDLFVDISSPSSVYFGYDNTVPCPHKTLAIPNGPLQELSIVASALPGALLFGPFEFNQVEVRQDVYGETRPQRESNTMYGDTIAEFFMGPTRAIVFQNDDGEDVFIGEVHSGDALLLTGYCRNELWRKTLYVDTDPIYTITLRMVQ